MLCRSLGLAHLVGKAQVLKLDDNDQRVEERMKIAKYEVEGWMNSSQCL
jgi:hypothetical protein